MNRKCITNEACKEEDEKEERLDVERTVSSMKDGEKRKLQAEQLASKSIGIDICLAE